MHTPDTGRRVGIFFDHATLAMIEEWRAAQRPVPTFSAAVRMLLWAGSKQPKRGS